MMTTHEIRTAFSLALVYIVRMLGLFMLIPVLPLYLNKFNDITPLLVGLAIGIYGLTQALLQIPLGLLSDRLGRKPVIIGGLVVRIGDTVYDGSVTNQLNQIRTTAVGRANQQIRQALDRFTSEA